VRSDNAQFAEHAGFFSSAEIAGGAREIAGLTQVSTIGRNRKRDIDETDRLDGE
jgi:hypothetical protein